MNDALEKKISEIITKHLLELLGTRDSRVYSQETLDAFLSLIEAEKRAAVEEVKKNVMQAALNAFIGAQTVSLHVNGKAEPSVDLKKMERLFVKSIATLTGEGKETHGPTE